MTFNEFENASFETPSADLAHLEPVTAQDAANAELNIEQFALQ